ncbi:hypothetical protein QT196_38560 (plasmid) [Streptomyces sp. P9-2B-2]|uniref:hypothetical protein n=1 Tax=Streptomyces sp. P9-2B-2 TaxID=3057114 RepID=UPI0025B601CA|nr:hypothetical protein [Streptomyces sp. P9-2B-2]WJY43173.1 hypothetical protein QT196_38560 [Streptomyces sp. P9-2B-2]
MALLFVGTDPESGGGNCPAVWVDTDMERPELVLQGWTAGEVMRARCAADSPPAANETVIRIPARMVPLIRKACDAAERAGTPKL